MNGNVKLQPFTCYFCNKVIGNETNEGHMTSCGAVLEPCPNKCGSYIQRMMRSRHLKDCINKQSQTLPRLTKQLRFDHSDAPVQNLYQPIGNPNKISSPTTEFPPQRSAFADMAKMSNKIGVLEGQLMHMQSNLEAIKSRQDKLQAVQAQNSQLSNHIEALKYQNHNFVEWRKTIDLEVGNLRYDFNQYARNKTEFDRRTIGIEEKLSTLQGLSSEIKVLKESLLQDQITSREGRNELKARLQKFEEFHAQENAALGGLWDDQRKRLEEIKEDLVNTAKNLEEQKLKHSTVVFDLRAVTQISTENAEKLEIQEREMISVRKSLTQLKLDMEILEDSQISRFFSRPGHLIWKMTDFKMKMESAKSTDLILRSPIFYSHEYGYKIRLIVYLNGIKKWKGRHMIACLHVLKGEYDLMLPWPCHIEGSVTIRDLYDYSNPRHTTKFISAKREHGDEVNEDPQESSTQYIFVPHTTLTKYNYIREDTLFLEIKIGKYMKHQEETSL